MNFIKDSQFEIKKNTYKLSFIKESDNHWYIDFPNWKFSHHNLMMVAGADKVCDAFSYKNKAHVIVETSKDGKKLDSDFGVTYQKTESSVFGGGYYKLSSISGEEHVPEEIWICPVTLFVLGEYPNFIHIINDYDTILPPQFEDFLKENVEDIVDVTVDDKSIISKYDNTPHILSLISPGIETIIKYKDKDTHLSRIDKHNIYNKMYLLKYKGY